MKVRKIYAVITGIVFLLVIFVGGFVAYGYISARNDPLEETVNSTPAQLSYESAQDPNDPPITPFRALNAKILLVPQATASAKEKKEYIAFVSKYASRQNTVEIKDCQPKPLVIWAKNGSEITIKNLDSSDHVIEVNSSHNLNVSKNSSAKIKADFGQGPGVYAYSCDDSNGPVGIFLVASE